VNEASFAERLLRWFDSHGRHDLPWQADATPYRVWISEIMLQQTQVQTVIPYFERFLDRFPGVEALADAPVDEVLHLWSGLGYYARGRNLHRAAIRIRDEHGARLPESLEALTDLPGIGRSTAGAILALTRGQRHPILDGNVRRVLCRHRGIAEWPGRSATLTRLWAIAGTLTPHERVGDYTQAIMDLGATVCRRSKPDCERCPVAEDCVARAQGRQATLPAPRPRRTRPLRRTRMLVVCDPDGRVLLERRPADGLWGGLWSLPEVAGGEDPALWCLSRLGCRPGSLRTMPAIRHGFTHFELEIEPLLLEVDGGRCAMAGEDRLWYNPRTPARVGLAAVVGRLLRRLAGDEEDVEGSGEAVGETLSGGKP
jgi:A/G-specific adenine glycosylase